MPTSPDGTIIRLGQAEAIKDAAGDLWSLDPDDGTVLLNGSQAGNGRGVVIAQSLGKIYVLGEDAVTWWLWLGDSYTLHGHTVPPGITIPTVPPPLPVPRRLANIPNNPAYSVQGNNTAAPILVAHAIAADGLDIPDNAYKWKLREAGGVDFEPHTGQTWTLAGMEPNKEFWADLTVFGQTFGRGFSVSVPLNQLPVSKYSVVINGLTATFTSLSTDPDNDAIAKEEWILPSGKVGTPEGNIQPDPFGPPAFATGKTATKTYPAPGKYWVQLRVTDARGGESKPIDRKSVV